MKYDTHNSTHLPFLSYLCASIALISMKRKEINKELIIKALAKTVADKEAVRLYLSGKITLETLTQKGITLAKPL